MKICIALGTRPEIIKFSPIIRKCERLGLDYYILHTGQHYSYSMDRGFCEQRELSEARYNLDVGLSPYEIIVGETHLEMEELGRE